MEKLDIHFMAEDDMYDFSEDQIQAMLELDLLQREANDYPDVNVRARLEEVNKALAEDPTPLESERVITVAFKPNLVDFFVSPASYSSFEEDEEDEAIGEADNGSRDSSEDDEDESATRNEDLLGRAVVKTNDFEDEKTTALVSGDENSDVESLEDNSDDGEVFVKNEKSMLRKSLVNSVDKRELDRGDSSVTSTELRNDSSENKRTFDNLNEKDHIGNLSGSSHEEEDPNAIHVLNVQPALSLNRAKRPPLTIPRSEDEGSSSTCLSIAVTDSSLPKPQKKTPRKKAEEVAAKAEAERIRKEAANQAFQIWLRQKRQKAKEKRTEKEREESENQKREECCDDNRIVVKEWFRKKRILERQHQEEMRRQCEEIQRQQEIRRQSREKVEMAFQKWIKSKQRQARLAQYEEKRRDMIIQLSLRTNRRSQSLALALNHQQNSFVNYYGYR